MTEEKELQEPTHTAQNPAHKFRTWAKILETEAHENNLIMLTNQGKVLIKLLKD